MTTDQQPFPKRRVLTADVSVGTFDAHIRAFAAHGRARRSSYVCCVNAHMTVECRRDPTFARVVNEADFATADGVPVLRTLQWLYRIDQERVAGNDIMPALLAEAARQRLSVYLYGSEDPILQRIRDRAAIELPELRFAGAHAPPFRPLAPEELDRVADEINASGAHIVLVSLGCPKQERWMAALKGRVQAIMLGVGGAFSLYAGLDTRAPKWMRDLLLEWVYRLWLEPRRLWKRYLITNSLFLWMLAGAVLRRALGRSTHAECNPPTIH
jgi:N-acetylglucosaminyldiphosphoundecaprenol N-acetyl-beta-D-mannosaminyltransferase